MKLKKSICFKTLLILTFIISHITFSQNRTVETTGDILLVALPVVSIGTTLIIKDKVGAWQFSKGFIVNQIATIGLKSIIDKERPNMSNNNSFPSGHSSTTFQSAAFIQKRYGWKYGVPAFLLASYTGFTRIDSNQHYFIDVLVGALVGIGSSYIFATPYQREHMKLTFSSGEGNYMLGFRFEF